MLLVTPLEKENTQGFHTLYLYTHTRLPSSVPPFLRPGRDVPATDERRQRLHAHNHLGKLLRVLLLDKAARLFLLLLLLLLLLLPEVVAAVVVMGLTLIRRGGCFCCCGGRTRR